MRIDISKRHRQSLEGCLKDLSEALATCEKAEKRLADGERFLEHTRRERARLESTSYDDAKAAEQTLVKREQERKVGLFVANFREHIVAAGALQAPGSAAVNSLIQICEEAAARFVGQAAEELRPRFGEKARAVAEEAVEVESLRSFMRVLPLGMGESWREKSPRLLNIGRLFLQGPVDIEAAMAADRVA
jgi:hypothetical protein